MKLIIFLKKGLLMLPATTDDSKLGLNVVSFLPGPTDCFPALTQGWACEGRFFSYADTTHYLSNHGCSLSWHCQYRGILT